MRLPPTSELDAVDPLRPGKQAKLPAAEPGNAELDRYFRNLAYGDEKDFADLGPNKDKQHGST